MAADARQVEREFDQAVNMTAKELDRWLATEESRAVGEGDGGESTGHRSGRRIVKILEKKTSERSDSDREHMRKVTGYVKRHRAQGPDKREDVEESRWRHSLMNWGLDPLK